MYPGVYIIEASAQLCGLLLGSPPTGEDGPPVLGYLASVRKFKFITPVYPGDVLSIQARAGVSHANLADFSVDIKVSGKIVASGSLALARIDPDPST